jgi:toxin CcdB
MQQFDVYANPNVAQRAAFPYIVVIQNDQLDRFNTRLMMPLSARPALAALPKRLGATIQIAGRSYVPSAHLCAALPTHALKEFIENVRDQQSVVRDALDAVLSGV